MKETSMRATLIAFTTLADGYEDTPCPAIQEWLDDYTELGWTTHDADSLAEFAGRACYESWNRPNEKTATNDGYMANIINQQHFSVLEHASATFYITGVSRSLTHELVRHRHLSFSQRSQRYVDESAAPMVYPPALKQEIGDAGWAIDHAVSAAKIAYDELMKYLTIVKKLPRKEARQAARCILPNMTSTSIVVTGNHRAWRDMLQKRWHMAADVEIRELSGMLLTQLRRIAPNTYQDIPTQPYGSVGCFKPVEN